MIIFYSSESRSTANKTQSYPLKFTLTVSIAPLTFKPAAQGQPLHASSPSTSTSQLDTNLALDNL